MTYRNAAKLHNRDQVTLKETGEVGEVLSVRSSPADPKTLVVEALFPRAGYRQVSHLEIA